MRFIGASMKGPLSKRLMPLAYALVAVIALIMALTWVVLQVQITLAGFLNSERLWSKAQKQAVIELRPRLDEVGRRIEAVREFQTLPEAPALAAAYKRVANILKKSSEAWPAPALDRSLLIEPVERELADTLERSRRASQSAYDAGDYSESLRQLAALKAPVDAFFNSVMVNAPDKALRVNRLALLQELRGTMNLVADLSVLAT